MKTIDLETFYSKRIKKHIKVVGDYLEKRCISDIIKLCRMKPYSLWTGELTKKTAVEKYWVDEFGNSLVIDKDTKIISILMNDTSLEFNTTVCTDLFYNNLEWIKENCKNVCVVLGSYFGKRVEIITYFGNDEYLRSFIICDGECFRISSLLLGVKSLEEIIKYFGKFALTEIDVGCLDCVIGMKIERCFVGSIEMMKRNEILKGII
jgi:hypothetical protein